MISKCHTHQAIYDTSFGDTSFGKYDTCELASNARGCGGAAAMVTMVSPHAPLREWTINTTKNYL